MLWIFTILLFLFGLASLPQEPGVGAGVLLVCAIIYEKKLKGRPFRLFPRRQRVAKKYREPQPKKLSRSERKRLEQQDNLRYQLQQKNNTITQLQQEVADLKKRLQEKDKVMNHSPHMKYYTDIAKEQIEDMKQREREHKLTQDNATYKANSKLKY